MMIYLCLFTAIFLQTGSAINPCTSDCNGLDGRFPDCSNCQLSHVCSNNQRTSILCTEGFQYDIISESCKLEQQAVCGTNFNAMSDQCTIDCSNVEDGEFPYCGDCGQYVICDKGTVVEIIQCTNNQVYNIEVRSCTSPNGALCGFYPVLGTRPSSSSTNSSIAGSLAILTLDNPDDVSKDEASMTLAATPCTTDCSETTRSGSFPFCTSCSTFVFCFQKQPRRFIVCQNGLLFDSVNLRCTLPKSAVCGVPAVTTMAPDDMVTPVRFIPVECVIEKCNEVTGIGQFPVCGVCDKSIICLGPIREPVITICNKGLLFDAVRRRCTFPSLAACGISEKPTSPATSPKTSPATSPSTTSVTQMPQITPRNTTMTTCSTNCRNIVGTRYVPFCDDCSRGLLCYNSGIFRRIQCPEGFLFDIVTRTCRLPQFTTCGVGEPTTTNATTPSTTTIRPETTCIRSCRGRRNGFYQSCRGCTFYAVCQNERLYDGISCRYFFARFWDDNQKSCVARSSTCFSVKK